MARCEVGIDIAATRERVWQLLSSAAWDPAVIQTKDAQPGTVGLVSSDGQVTDFDVAGVEDESSLTWRRSVVPLLLTESWTFLLGDSGAGVRVEVAQAVHGPSAMVLGRLVPDRAGDIMRVLAGLQSSAGRAEG